MISLRKVIHRILNFRAGKVEDLSLLIPCSRVIMFSVLKKFDKDPAVEWPIIGQLPILNNRAF